MIGYVLALSFLLLLVKLPPDISLPGVSNMRALMAPHELTQEFLPLVTAHEIRSDASEPERAAPPKPVEDVVDAEGESDAIPTAEAPRPTRLQSPIAHRRPEAVTSSIRLVDLAGTSRYMHTAISAPTVDDAPRLHLGSMLIEYPLAALKKAIQGLVIVRFTVETDGRAYGIDIVSGLEPECDAAVVSALREARFTPGSDGGRIVPALSQMAVHFKIVDSSR